MSFTDPAFAWLALATFAVWRLCRNNDRARLPALLVPSLIFYGYDQWHLLPLILVYCLVGWGVGNWIAVSRRPRVPLALGICFCLGALAYWKYAPLLSTLGAAGAAPGNSATNWTIPVGISFYAFTTIAYLADVSRGTAPAERSLGRFSLFITFFPQLVAGPILRADQFLPALQAEQMPRHSLAPREALLLVGRGLFKKLVLANHIALAIDPFFAHVTAGSTAGVWALPYLYLYAFQIYFDFSGYTDIARGLGLLFGFRWPENFDRPYLAASVQEFWRRWHMTLSAFLKDYIYVPLGGSGGGPWKTARNLMITMLLGGLWHGANWSFLVWGGIHGVLLVIHRAWAATGAARWLASRRGMPLTLWRLSSTVLTFHCVCLAWSFFRLTEFSSSLTCLQKCLLFDPQKMLAGGACDLPLWCLLAAYCIGAEAGRWLETSASGGRPVVMSGQRASFGNGFAWGLAAGLLLLSLVLSPFGESPPFIYFQF